MARKLRIYLHTLISASFSAIKPLKVKLYQLLNFPLSPGDDLVIINRRWVSVLSNEPDWISWKANEIRFWKEFEFNYAAESLFRMNISKCWLSSKTPTVHWLEKQPFRDVQSVTVSWQPCQENIFKLHKIVIKKYFTRFVIPFLLCPFKLAKRFINLL